MTISKNKACRWTALAVSISAFVSFPPAFAQALPSTTIDAASTGTQSGADDTAMSAPPAAGMDAAAAGQQELYLDVSVNQSSERQLARFVLQDERFYASPATLRELGLKWPDGDGGELVALDDIPGLDLEYDVPRQRLSLRVPLALLDGAPTQLGFVQPERPRVDPATRAPGLILNYDLYGQHNDDFQNLSGVTELRLFGAGRGVWSNTMASRYASGNGQRSERGNIRLDTSWQLDFPDSMVSLTVGDTLTGNVPWSRATRIGGIRLSRNFSLQPYRVTTPLASFAGEAALPSTVDLFINGMRQSSEQVQPGQFQIDSVPSVNGAGQAQMVITDINGQSRVVSFALYGSPELLQAGLSDWSIDAGKVRRDYGIRSFSYHDDAMFSASGRHGLSDQTTIEGHAEATEGLQLAGIGGARLLGERGGVVSASVAGSRHDGMAGEQYSVGYQWSSRWFNLALESTRRDAAFRDVAASLEDSPLPRRTDQAFFGVDSGLGQFGASYIRQQYDDTERTRFVSLNWSRQLPHNAMISLSLNRDLDNDQGTSAFLYLSLPLDRYTTTAASARHTRNAQSVSLDASRSVPGDLGGWGWRAQATLGDGAGGQAQVSQLGRYGQWAAGLNYFRGGHGVDASSTAYANANGGLVLMAGHAYAMRRVDDAFALVSTNGIAGVPVKLENRVVGQTDEHGLLLINRLNAWQFNQLAIDPMQLPADMQIDRTTMDAVPESRSGMLASFPMHRILSLQFSLRDARGQYVPAGSPVWLNADAAKAGNPADTVVGHDGQVFLQDPAARTRLHVRAAGGLCTVALPALAKTEGWINLGELSCR